MLLNLDTRKWISLGIFFAFLVNTFGPLPLAQAGDFRLPAPGVMVHLSSPFVPPILKGIKVHPDNPLRFDFILDKGDASFSLQESTKLIKYFLASLTIPEKDLWVNLSPYEKDRIVPQSFGQTEMGRDLLAEDYMLKQITASLMYPEDTIGKKFWKRIYEEAAQKFGTTNIPVNTFNKVWIVPEKAVVYENAKAGTAYVVESKLKVMLEQDYLSMSKHADGETRGQGPDSNKLGSDIVREVVIPELTREVNEGKNFARLRQVYNSLILATWYKKKIKDSILERVYADKKKIAGVGYDQPNDVEAIYQRYLQAFKKGVFNYIKEDAMAIPGMSGKEQDMLPRKYFSGGTNLKMDVYQATQDAHALPSGALDDAMVVGINVEPKGNASDSEDLAMMGDRADMETLRRAMIQEGPMPVIDYPDPKEIGALEQKFNSRARIDENELELLIRQIVAENRNKFIETIFQSRWPVLYLQATSHHRRELGLAGEIVRHWCGEMTDDLIRRFYLHRVASQLDLLELPIDKVFKYKSGHFAVLARIKDSPKVFLIDTTFRQFFNSEQPDEMAIGFYMRQHAPEFTENMLRDGYALLNNHSLTVYANAFLAAENLPETQLVLTDFINQQIPQEHNKNAPVNKLRDEARFSENIGHWMTSKLVHDLLFGDQLWQELKELVNSRREALDQWIRMALEQGEEVKPYGKNGELEISVENPDPQKLHFEVFYKGISIVEIKFAVGENFGASDVVYLNPALRGSPWEARFILKASNYKHKTGDRSPSADRDKAMTINGKIDAIKTEEATIDQMDPSFYKWVKDGLMADNDIRLLEQILSGDEDQLKVLLSQQSKKIFIKKAEKTNPENEGRAVYLRLEKPFPTPNGDITVLRIKGVRPRGLQNGDAKDLPSYSGRGLAGDRLTVDEQGNWFLRSIEKVSSAKNFDPLLLAPKGAMLKEEADWEYHLMQVGMQKKGFETDYPIAVGLWNNKTHAGRPTGFFIAGMRSDDVRTNVQHILYGINVYKAFYKMISTKHPKFVLQTNSLLRNIMTGKVIYTDLDMGKRIYKMIGRSLRAYHDAGYFHRNPHHLNLGVEIGDNQDIRVILRDLETTITRQNMKGDLNRAEAGYRLIDLYRIIFDLNYFFTLVERSTVDPLIAALLEGYFYELKPNTPEFNEVLEQAVSKELAETAYNLKESSQSKLVLNQNVPFYGNVWKNLYNIAIKNSAPIRNENGGIDLTSANMNLQTQNNGSDIKYHINPAMLEQLQNASGFVPVIIDVAPLTNLKVFLGLPAQ